MDKKAELVNLLHEHLVVTQVDCDLVISESKKLIKNMGEHEATYTVAGLLQLIKDASVARYDAACKYFDRVEFVHQAQRDTMKVLQQIERNTSANTDSR